MSVIVLTCFFVIVAIGAFVVARAMNKRLFSLVGAGVSTCAPTTGVR